jgi:hypothetical protein
MGVYTSERGNYTDIFATFPLKIVTNISDMIYARLLSKDPRKLQIIFLKEIKENIC